MYYNLNFTLTKVYSHIARLTNPFSSAHESRVKAENIMTDAKQIRDERRRKEERKARRRDGTYTTSSEPFQPCSLLYLLGQLDGGKDRQARHINTHTHTDRNRQKDRHTKRQRGKYSDETLPDRRTKPNQDTNIY